MTAPPITNANAIHDHLYGMAERLPGSILSIGTVQVFGLLGYPDPDKAQQSFQVDPRLLAHVQPPREGQTVQVKYETSTAGFGFMTSYLGPYCEGLWRLAIPRNIDCYWQRRFQRLKIPALFRANHHTALHQEVLEVSAGGFSLALEDPQSLAVDTQIQGQLSMLDLPPITVFAKVRRVEEKGTQHVAGCSFEDIDPADRRQIEALIRDRLG